MLSLRFASLEDATGECMICGGDSGPLRALVDVMETAGCLLDDFNSDEKSGLKSRLGGVKQMSSYFVLSGT